MNITKTLPVLALSLVLFGCASGTKYENLAYTETTGLTFDSALKSQVGVSPVQGGSKTNPLWKSQISNEAFQKALKSSLASQGLLSPTGRYQLSTNLDKVEQPLMGFDFVVWTYVTYKLTDGQSGKVVMSEQIVTPYKATMGDSVIGLKRLRMATEGSGKNNIQSFLEKLAKLDISAGDVSLVN